MNLGLTNKTGNIRWDAFPLTTKLLSFYSNDHIWSLWREAVSMAVDRYINHDIVPWCLEEGSGIVENMCELEYS